VQSTASGLDTQWSAIESSGSGDRERIKNVRSLTDYRDLWPKLLADINSTIPKLPPDPAKLKAIPRPQREQVHVETVVTKYEPNVGLAIADPDFKKFAGATGTGAAVGSFAMPAAAGAAEGDMATMEDPAMYGLAPAAPPPPAAVASATPAAAPTSGAGFLITLTGTTPHAEPAAFLQDTVIKNLEAFSLEKLPKDKRYYVAKAEIVTTTPVRSNQTRIQQMVQVFQAAEQSRGATAQPGIPVGGVFDPGTMEQDPALAGNVGVQPGVGPNGQPLEDTRPFRDRLIPEEDVRDDSEFTIVFAVVIDPTPPATPAADPNAPAPTAAATP